MPFATAASSWFSILPRGLLRSPTAGPYVAPPSCIKSRTTPLFQGPSPLPRESKPTSGATSRCARSRAISAAQADTGAPGDQPRGGASLDSIFGRAAERVRPAIETIVREEDIGGRLKNGKASHDGGGLCRARRRTPASPAGRASTHHPADYRCAYARRPLRECRI